MSIINSKPGFLVLITLLVIFSQVNTQVTQTEYEMSEVYNEDKPSSMVVDPANSKVSFFESKV